MGKKNGDAPTVEEGQLAIAEFKGKEIRKVLHDDEWYFSVVDVVEALADTSSPRRYWSDLKVKLANEEGFDQLYDRIVQLKMVSSDGKHYATDAADTETIFRIIQSIPSKKAETFKRWLARVGYERVLEYQNPEIAIKRAILDYRLQGYADEWINARVRSIMVRNELVGEWSKRGVREGLEYAILTNVIQEETFDLGVQAHKGRKGLKKHHNLRDHMTDTELIFTMLGERSTRDIAVASDAEGFDENEDAAREDGRVAGDAREALERKTGKRVVSSNNFLRPKGDQGTLGQ
jgi:DNA-damage-inducible protein D